MKKLLSVVLCLLFVFTLFSMPASAEVISNTKATAASIGCTLREAVVVFSASINDMASNVSSVSVTMYTQRRAAGSSNSWTVFGVYSDSGDIYAGTETEKDYMSNYEYRTYAVYTVTFTDGTSNTFTKTSRVV